MGDTEPRHGAAVPAQGSSSAAEQASAEESSLTPEDEALLGELAGALAAVDPVPPVLVDAARQSWTWRTVDADIAALIGDSAAEPATVRAEGPASRRTLTFEAGATAVVVEVAAVGRLRRLLGQIVRPRAAEVQVRHPSGSVTVTTDELGRFSVADVPAGPLSLVCRFLDDAARPVVTSWVTV